MWPAKGAVGMGAGLGEGKPRGIPHLGLGRLRVVVCTRRLNNIYMAHCLSGVHTGCHAVGAPKENKTTIKGGLCHGLKGFRNI